MTATISKFERVLEDVEALPEIQREHLIEVVQHRLVELRRDEIARNIREAKKEYRAGTVRKGRLNDLMKDLKA